MTGSLVVLLKNGVEVKTQFTDREHVRWIDGEDKKYSHLLTDGFIVVSQHPLREALEKIHQIRDAYCFGRKTPDNTMFLEVIRLLEAYLEA